MPLVHYSLDRLCRTGSGLVNRIRNSIKWVRREASTCFASTLSTKANTCSRFFGAISLMPALLANTHASLMPASSRSNGCHLPSWTYQTPRPKCMSTSNSRQKSCSSSQVLLRQKLEHSSENSCNSTMFRLHYHVNLYAHKAYSKFCQEFFFCYQKHLELFLIGAPCTIYVFSTILSFVNNASLDFWINNFSNYQIEQNFLLQLFLHPWFF